MPLNVNSMLHTFAYKIAQSPKCEKLFIAPGNAGTSNVGENVALNVADFSGIKDFIIEKNVNMLVVGPEDPLVKGITDFCKGEPELKDLLIVGPFKTRSIVRRK